MHTRISNMHNQLTWKCPACGTEARLPADHGKVRCFCGYTQYQNPPGPGDRVAATLARLGITEHRYKKAKRAVGLKGDCGCKKRQQRLNKLGREPD